MDNINCKIQSDATIRDALEVIDAFAIGAVLVLDADAKLLGLLTDGDIRRASDPSIVIRALPAALEVIAPPVQ